MSTQSHFLPTEVASGSHIPLLWSSVALMALSANNADNCLPNSLRAQHAQQMSASQAKELRLTGRSRHSKATQLVDRWNQESSQPASALHNVLRLCEPGGLSFLICRMRLPPASRHEDKANCGMAPAVGQVPFKAT